MLAWVRPKVEQRRLKPGVNDPIAHKLAIRIPIGSRIAVCLLLMVLLAGVCIGQQASKPKAPKSQRVKIYFYRDPGEYIDLSPVTRVIKSNAPARVAINALLDGPTPAEEKKGFSALSSANEFAIGRLTIKNGTARVNFVASRTWAGWAGDLAPVRFKKAVELTLKQFANVREVIVSLNGDVNFASERY